MDMIKHTFQVWEDHKKRQLENMKQVFQTEEIQHVSDTMYGCIYEIDKDAYYKSGVSHHATTIDNGKLFLRVRTYDYYTV